MRKLVAVGDNCMDVYSDGTYFPGGNPVNVVDTMGAGDSYIAGFLKGIMENKSIYDCMALGAKTASDTISYAGTWG